jgi:hypothetical protein
MARRARAFDPATGAEELVPFPTGGGSGIVRQRAVATRTTTFSTTAEFANLTSVPQQSDGAEFLTCSITPTAADSILAVRFFCPFISASAISTPGVALFRDAVANALATTSQTITTANFLFQIAVGAEAVAGSTDETTFKIRLSRQPGGTSTAYLLRNNVDGRYDLNPVAYLEIIEYAPPP